MRAWIMGCALLAGCTLVNDPGAHQGGIDAGVVDAGQPDAAAPVEALQFCDRFAELLCDAHFRCCLETEPSPADLDDCLAAVQGVCREGTDLDLTGPILGDIAIDSRTGYDPQLAGNVFAEGEMLVAASCDPGFWKWKDVREGLLRVLTGTADRGGTCEPDPPEGLRPDYGAFLSCKRAEDGSYRRCAQNSDAEWRCAERGGDGVACRSDFDCLNDYFCTGNFTTPGECRLQKANGESCSANNECQSLFCAGGSCGDPTQDEAYCEMM